MGSEYSVWVEFACTCQTRWILLKTGFKNGWSLLSGTEMYFDFLAVVSLAWKCYIGINRNGHACTCLCNQYHWGILVLASILNSSAALIGVNPSLGGGLLGTISFFQPWQIYLFLFRWKADPCSRYLLTLSCASDRRCWTVSIAFQHVSREETSGWGCH